MVSRRTGHRLRRDFVNHHRSFASNSQIARLRVKCVSVRLTQARYMANTSSFDCKPRLVDRIQLWLSTGRNVDGLWVGAIEKKQKREALLRPVEDALRLIKNYSKFRYDR